MSNDVLIPILLMVGIFGLLACFTIGAALWEKRPIRPYYIPDEGQEYEPSPTAREANAQALEQGFRHDCLCHDGKSNLYRVRYDLWISPDASTFALIGSGTVASISVNEISLYSRDINGRVLHTNNNAGDQDISGVEKQVTWPRCDFAGLAQKHYQRLSEIVPRTFDDSSALNEYFEIERLKAESLVRRGYAYYMDEDRLAWRYNLRGALTFCAITSWGRPFIRGLRWLGLVRS